MENKKFIKIKEIPESSLEEIKQWAKEHPWIFDRTIPNPNPDIIIVDYLDLITPQNKK